MKEFKQLAGQTLIYGLGTMVPRFLNYVLLTSYFTHNLFLNAQAEYGKVTELYAYIAFLMIILTYGMETTFFRFVSSEKDKSKVFSTILTSIVITSIFFIIAVLVFTTPIAAGLKYSGESIFIRLLGGILAVEAISAIPFAKLRSENKAIRFALLKTLQIALNIGIMLTIYNLGPTVLHTNSFLLNDSLVVSSKFIFISNFIASTLVLFFLIPEFKDYRFSKFDFKLVRPLLVYGLPLMISGLAGVINETLDRAVFKHVISDENKALKELGIYGANYKIGGFLLMFIQMYRYAVEPYFFNKSKDSDSKEQYSNLMNLFVGIIISMGLFILLFLDYLKYFIGATYRDGLFVVPYIVLAYILSGILFNLSVWFKLSDKTKYAFIIMSIGAVITIVINIVYIPKYSYGASAIAHVVSYTIMVLISYLLSRRYFRIQYNLARIFVYFALGFTIYFAFKYWFFNYWAVEIILKGVVLLLFVTFVAWKEKIIKFSYKNGN